MLQIGRANHDVEFLSAMGQLSYITTRQRFTNFGLIDQVHEVSSSHTVTADTLHVFAERASMAFENMAHDFLSAPH